VLLSGWQDVSMTRIFSSCCETMNS